MDIDEPKSDGKTRETPRYSGLHRRVNPQMCGPLFKLALAALTIALFILATCLFR
jgi:hypothetical protein